MSPVAAIVLAAGRGTRFGAQPKLLASLDGEPLVRRVAEAALASRASPVLVVVGHRQREVMAALAGAPVLFVPNPRYADGLAASLQAGFATLPPQVRGAVVLLADMPRVSASIIDRLIDAWRSRGEPPALVPTFGGQRGNPVLLSRTLAAAIAGLSGDVGAGALLRSHPGVREEPVEDPAVLQDVDTVAALTALKS